jgi:hypothetical protein
LKSTRAAGFHPGGTSHLAAIEDLSMIYSGAGLPIEDDQPEIAALFLAERAGQVPKRRRRDWLTIELTDQLIEMAQCRERENWIQDSVNQFLALRLRPTGGKSFYFLFSDREFHECRRDFLGNCSDYTVAEARCKADQFFKMLPLFEKPPKRLRRTAAIEEVAPCGFV